MNKGKMFPRWSAKPSARDTSPHCSIGDLWRWGMRRDNVEESDLERSWRQTARWLVSDVPSRLDVSVRPRAKSSVPAIELAVRVRDAEYRALITLKLRSRSFYRTRAPLRSTPNPMVVKLASIRPLM